MMRSRRHHWRFAFVKAVWADFDKATQSFTASGGILYSRFKWGMMIPVGFLFLLTSDDCHVDFASF
jgi:hypothetical protein